MMTENITNINNINNDIKYIDIRCYLLYAAQIILMQTYSGLTTLLPISDDL